LTLRRGFRAQAERQAADLRGELGLAPHEPVDLTAVAKRLGVRVVPADELIDIDRLHELERIQAFAFSACTLDIDGTKVIVFNPLRSLERQNSDIAHELAHLLLEHQLSEIRSVAGIPFRTCRPEQEEEATNLAGTLLLPRPLLLQASRQTLDVATIAEQFSVTLEMARFRFNTTGVAKQARTRRHHRYG
jgi:Zn-dependent peptidase ImmA (M78 family)